ncbi:MAG: hypothetical protein PHF44_00480 [Candidatus Pacebacteria bacterium]|nr:hypothetical protein [Candidatus Paceibacterota bacterium]
MKWPIRFKNVIIIDATFGSTVGGKIILRRHEADNFGLQQLTTIENASQLESEYKMRRVGLKIKNSSLYYRGEDRIDSIYIHDYRDKNFYAKALCVSPNGVTVGIECLLTGILHAWAARGIPIYCSEEIWQAYRVRINEYTNGTIIIPKSHISSYPKKETPGIEFKKVVKRETQKDADLNNLNRGPFAKFLQTLDLNDFKKQF